MDFLLALAVAYLGWRLWKGFAPRRKPVRRPSPSDREADALATLGLTAPATDADVRAAHRRLIAAVHPDRGGSAELARRINAARDVLLRPRD